MNVLITITLTIQLLAAIAMIGLVLVQQGKGADMGAAFGSGGSGSLFGATGGANFMSRSTAVLAAVFFSATLALAYMGNLRPSSSGSVLERAGTSAPASVASGAAAVPGAGSLAPASSAAAPAAPVASGAAQIPGK